MAKRPKPTPEQRIAEYVDSPRMTQRVRYKRKLLARIWGNFGAYQTTAATTKKVTGDCTCPSDYWPCKHVHALRKTWEVNPKSFLDLSKFLAELSKKPQKDLVKAIGEIVMKWPECLQVFGVPGFDEVDEDQIDWDEW